MSYRFDRPWYAGRATPGPEMRVSNDERNEVAESLSKHYADGRLDDTEFKERLDKAMGAKTRSDLSGLLTDLPTTAVQATAPGPPHRLGLFAIVAVALVMAIAWSTWAVPHVPWFLIGVVVVLLWARGRSHRHHAHGHAADAGRW